MTELDSPKKALTDFTQEIRFAVVMYGGASLAIYMNGVAQELLRLVRATAPARGKNPAEAEPNSPIPALYQQPGGSEAVYRKLGRMLSHGAEPDVAAKDDEEAPIRTQFVIDILSGTSAGGINAVFLAKALANNQQMDQLKQMWIEQGDIGVLINDKASDADINLGTQDPPRSLLNSRRMYYQLLDALQKMDNGSRHDAAKGATADSPDSPFVDELDLFTTATDIWGQPISMRLADAVARERRHLNTFHFRYSSKETSGVDQNDFTAEFNPFLAFAARVTSAHPAPFEPMKLSDIDEVLDRHQDYRNVTGFRSDDPRWEAFFEEYLQRPEDGDSKASAAQSRTAEGRQKLREKLAEKFRTRPFSDGGVLDNSPFSFAINRLQFRHTRLPVDRKLIYIEPVPEHPEKAVPADRPPDALKNALLSLSTLPRYQFIRDDLHRLLERNRLIDRVNRILKGVERDEAERIRKRTQESPLDSAPEGQAEAPLNTYQFGQKTVGEMIELMGSAWGGYQRLRVAETTDELVSMIARASGFDEQSDEHMAIRYLVRTWRFQNYDAYGKGRRGYLSNEVPASGAQAESKDSENLFLYRYDLNWRLRRLKFLLRKAEEISCLDQRALELLDIPGYAPEVREMLSGTRPPAPDSDEGVKELSVQERVRRELRSIKWGLSDVLRELNIARHQLLSRARANSPRPGGDDGHKHPALDNPLGAAVEKLEITADELLQILVKTTDHDREKVAEEILRTKQKEFDLFLGSLNTYLERVMTDVSARIRGEGRFRGKGILEAPRHPQTPEEIVRRALSYFYNNFDRYDVISYPILYATKVGEETDMVEVFRISPEDAKVLIEDEELRRRKLAGTSLGNFGAFFDRDFRTNDMLWGRLDCADRIITALLSSASPQSDAQQQALEKTRRELVEEASRAIIAEELRATDKAGLRGLLAAAMNNTRTGEDNAQFISELRKLLAEQRSPDLSEAQKFLSACLEGTDPLRQFIQTSSFKHELPTTIMVRSAARASKVFGKMLEGIAELHHIDSRRAAWMTRLGQLFWGLLEVAVPDSIPNLVFTHWLKLLYFFEVLLVLGGTLLLNPPAQKLGFFAFGLTVMLNIIVLLIGDKMRSRDEDETATTTTIKGTRRKKKWRLLPILKAAAFAGIILLTILGAILLAAIFGADSLWPFILKVARPDQPAETALVSPPGGTNYFRLIIRWAMVGTVVLVFLGSIRRDLKAFFKGR